MCCCWCYAAADSITSCVILLAAWRAQTEFCDRRMTRKYTVIIMQVFDLFSDQESVMLLLCCAKMCTVWNVWWKVSHFSCFVSHLRSQHGTHGPEQRWNILISKTFSTNCLEILSEHVCGGRWWGRGSRITWRDRVLQFWHWCTLYIHWYAIHHTIQSLIALSQLKSFFTWNWEACPQRSSLPVDVRIGELY